MRVTRDKTYGFLTIVEDPLQLIIKIQTAFYAQNIVSNQANLLGLGLNVKYLSGAGVCVCFASYKTLKRRLIFSIC